MKRFIADLLITMPVIIIVIGIVAYALEQLIKLL